VCKAEQDGENRDDDSDCAEVAQGEAGGSVGGMAGVWSGVLPGVDEEAVEATEGREEKTGGKERYPEIGTVSDGRDEGCGGKEDTDSNLFRKAVGYGLRSDGGSGMDEDEVASEKSTEDEVKVDDRGFEAWKKSCESYGDQEDPG
jgi:hypothetical protein